MRAYRFVNLLTLACVGLLGVAACSDDTHSDQPIKVEVVNGHGADAPSTSVETTTSSEAGSGPVTLPADPAVGTDVGSPVSVGGVPASTPPPTAPPPTATPDTPPTPAVIPVAPPVVSDTELVAVKYNFSVGLATDFPMQLHDNAYKWMNPTVGKGKLYARFCKDADCAQPFALVPLDYDKDYDKAYDKSTGLFTLGTGNSTPVVLSQAPKNDQYFAQIILDTEFGKAAGKGSCTTATDCPGDADVVLMTGAKINITNVTASSADNPKPATVKVADLANHEYFLGAIYFSGKEIWAQPPHDKGTLLVATSGFDGVYLNRIVPLDLAALPAGAAASSAGYTLQKNNGDFAGNICTFVRGEHDLYVVGQDSDGASVFRLDPSSGAQHVVKPIATLTGTTPAPCRGVAITDASGTEHLYFVHYRGGAGIDLTSSPAPLYHVNTKTGAYQELYYNKEPYISQAWRAIDTDGASLFIAEMSWSKDGKTNGKGKDRLIKFTLKSDGTIDLSVVPKLVATSVASNDNCGYQFNVPTALRVVKFGDQKTYVLLGHDTGVATFDTNLNPVGKNLDLQYYGRLITDLQTAPDGKHWYALPGCPSAVKNDATDFKVVNGSGTTVIDKHLVPALEAKASALTVVPTDTDIDNDGKPNVGANGTDLEYSFLKYYIRTFQNTLSMPDVGYTTPQIVVSNTMLFLRGNGITKTGVDDLNSSGVSQVQDLGIFDLQTNRGIVFRKYLPFFDGLSAGAGKAPGIWGFELGKSNAENSTRAMIYLP